MTAAAAHKEDMTTLTVSLPSAGARFRKLSTGRTWHVERITESGLVALAEEYYGAGCDVREYETPADLDALIRGAVAWLPHTSGPWKRTVPVRHIRASAPGSP